MKLKNKKGQEGQSTIEFIMSFTAAVGFIFLFLKMALNYTNGFMVHHATYMASRAYMVGDSESGGRSVEERDRIAFNLAKDVFKKYLPSALITGSPISTLQVNNPQDGRSNVFSGVYVTLTQTFSSSFIGGKSSIDFVSESFLGREPSRAESIAQTCEAIRAITKVSCDHNVTLDDNGG